RAQLRKVVEPERRRFSQGSTVHHPETGHAVRTEIGAQAKLVAETSIAGPLREPGEDVTILAKRDVPSGLVEPCDFDARISEQRVARQPALDPLFEGEQQIDDGNGWLELLALHGTSI